MNLNPSNKARNTPKNTPKNNRARIIAAHTLPELVLFLRLLATITGTHANFFNTPYYISLYFFIFFFIPNIYLYTHIFKCYANFKTIKRKRETFKFKY